MQGLPESTRSRRQDSNEDMIPAPLSSPAMRRDESRHGMQGNERPQTPKVEKSPEVGGNQGGDFAVVGGTSNSSKAGSPRPSYDKGKNEMNNNVVAPTVVPAQPSSSPLETPVAPADDERPGLGPMIKKKMSKGDVANTFRRAANAANAFKPRAGGAAERLREQQAKLSEGPDGITSVVPAPSLVRGVSTDSTRAGTPDSVNKEKAPVKNLTTVSRRSKSLSHRRIDPAA